MIKPFTNTELWCIFFMNPMQLCMCVYIQRQITFNLQIVYLFLTA